MKQGLRFYLADSGGFYTRVPASSLAPAFQGKSWADMEDEEEDSSMYAGGFESGLNGVAPPLDFRRSQELQALAPSKSCSPSVKSDGAPAPSSPGESSSLRVDAVLPSAVPSHPARKKRQRSRKALVDSSEVLATPPSAPSLLLKQ